MTNIETSGRYIFPRFPVRAAVLDASGEVAGVGEVAYSTRDGLYAIRLDGRRNSQEWPARRVSFDECDLVRANVSRN